MIQYESQIKRLTKFLSDQNIEYAILGGIVVSIYGEPRFTADIDVSIILDKKNIKDFIDKAKKSDLYPVTAIKKTTGVIPVIFRKGKISAKIDIIIAENSLEFSSIRRAKALCFGRVLAKFITAEDLVIHKIASNRPRDIEDLAGILIRQKGKLDIRYIQNWLMIIDKANKTKLSGFLRNLLEKYY